MAREICIHSEEMPKAHEAPDLDRMESELECTRKIAQRLRSPIVFSHNDLLSGNVLVAYQARLIMPTPAD